MTEKLFEITTEHLETGLRGFPVGYCTTSYVDPTQGIFYCGKPISKLIRHTPEEVIYLLFHGKEGGRSEIADFHKEFKKHSACSKEVIEHIHRLPRRGHPMKLMAAALLLLGIFESKNDYKEDCINLIAKVPHLVALVINHHAQWGETPAPSPKLGYMENFVHMLKMPHKKGEELVALMRLFNILHYDHGGGNLSTFVAKAVASGLEDLYGSMASGMCALDGPRHGKANQDSLEFVKTVLRDLGEDATSEQVNHWLRKHLERGGLATGFGHAVLRVEDPRATAQYEFAKKHYPDHPLVKIALLLREEGTRVLMENPKISDPHPNIDAISGTLLTAAGFGYPEYFTLLFGLARTVGISIQIVYERCEARKGKGTPIVRPRYLYKERTAH